MTTGVFESAAEVTLPQACKADTGIFIPVQQRSYVWDKKDLEVFFHDIKEGMENFASDRVHNSTFVGAMTFFHDKKGASFDRKTRDDLPAEVLSVMDGQQRLTTLMITVVLLHRYILSLVNDCSNDWLRNTIAPGIYQELQKIFEIHRSEGELYHYPRMIRAFDDRWSTDSITAQYRSPISKFIHLYGNAFRKNEPFDIKDLEEKGNSEPAPFIKKAGYILEKIHAICGRSASTSSETGSFNAELVRNASVIEIICGMSSLPEKAELDWQDENQQQLMKALFLASYVLKRISFVSLVSKRQADALRIFISLNTTGQPLTAIEILKPAVIDFEGGDLDYHRNSSAKQYFEKIDAYIGGIPAPKDQQKVAREIVIHFALAESGRRLPGDIKEQQNFLETQFKDALKGRLGPDQVKEGREFMRLLSSVVEFRECFWDNCGLEISTKLQLHSNSNDIPVVQLCMKYLKASGHSICLSLLTRFYFDYLVGKATIDDLFGVIKAAAAFFAIWRATRATTDSIDSYHRDLFGNGISTKDSTEVLPPLNRISGNTADLSKVKAAFRHILKTHNRGHKVKIGTQNGFQDAVREIPLYRIQRETAKFLLLVSHHDVVPSTEGKLEAARRGQQNMLSGEIWDDTNYAEIEHIIPQSRAEDEAERKRLDRIGNLTLLSKKANLLLRDLPWEPRRIIYEIMSTPKLADVEIKLKDESGELAKHKIKLKKGNIEDLLQMSATPMVRALTYEQFDMDKADTRGENISERAWAILYKNWLK